METVEQKPESKFVSIVRSIWQNYSIVVVFVIILIICGIAAPRFLRPENLLNILRNTSIIGVIALGMTFVIITAGIDLSVGSMLAMCGMIGSISMLAFSGAPWDTIARGSYVELTTLTMLGGTFIGVIAGALCGLVNGLLITRLKLAHFIVTLGMMSVFRGVAYIMNDCKPIAVSDYTWLDIGTVAGIPSAVVLLIVVFSLAGFILKYTPLCYEVIPGFFFYSSV